MKIFSFLLTFNLVAAAAVTCLILLAPLMRRITAGRRLTIHYATLAFAFIVSTGVTLKGGGEIFEPVVKVWSAAATSGPAFGASAEHGALQVHRHALPVPADYFFLFSVGLAAGAGFVGLFYVLRGARQISRMLRRAHALRRLGRVRVLISDEVDIPFSYRSPRFAYVVVPQYLITNANSLRLTIAHELQHHRQRDTRWAYALLLTRAVCFMNPFVHFWNHWIGELQEFACDEALVGRHGALKQDYARCLIEVAETAWVHGSVPAGATGMILLNRGNLLNRRIQVMFKEKSNTGKGKVAGLTAFAMIASLLTATAFATKNLVQDRRVTLAQAQRMNSATSKESAFPVVVNDEVLKFLNHYIGTPDGREKMRIALRRLESYRPMVEAKIADYDVPTELLAIPLIESGYQNLPDRNKEGYGAGLWMFIASTAKAYGLKVEGHVDQRLDEALLTDAAMRYLLANRLRFKDWPLSVLAYNAGESSIQQAINESGTRDAWSLVRDSRLSTESKNYLPKLMAAILIMRNPSSVD